MCPLGTRQKSTVVLCTLYIVMQVLALHSEPSFVQLYIPRMSSIFNIPRGRHRLAQLGFTTEQPPGLRLDLIKKHRGLPMRLETRFRQCSRFSD